METLADFIFWDSITADGDCSDEIKRCLLLGRKVVVNPDSILKSTSINYFASKGLSSQSYVFPGVMYGCESWTKRKLSAEELILLNCGVEDSRQSLELQGDPTGQS